MLYECYWYINQRVLYQKVSGTLTIDDIETIQRDGIPRIASGTRFVHVILDVTGVTNFPVSLHEIGRVVHKTDNSEKIGWTIIVASNRLLQFFGSTLVQLVGVRVRVFKTLDEGLTFLSKEDNTVPLLKRDEV